jgi:hypothetical protein
VLFVGCYGYDDGSGCSVVGIPIRIVGGRMMLYDVLCDERFHDEIFFTSFQCHHEYVDLFHL